MSVVELVCIRFGESAVFSAEKVLKNLPLAPLAPPPKLGETRSSFGRRGTFGKSFLPRFCPLCPFCPRWDCLCFMRLGRLNEPMCDYSGGRSSCQGVTALVSPATEDGIAGAASVMVVTFPGE